MFDYTTTISKRSKQFKLKISPEKGLEIVGPREPNPKMVERMINSHRVWIEKHLQKINTIQTYTADTLPRPNNLSLRAVNQEFNLHFSEPNFVAKVEKNGPDSLIISPNEQGEWHQALVKWMNRMVPEVLTPMLEQEAARTGLTFSRVQYRNQKTRWGSCSTSGTISLNRNLIFLPENLVRYVMVHELCHTIHMDHSNAFWALVEEHDPFYKPRDAELRTAKTQYVPEWYRFSPAE